MINDLQSSAQLDQMQKVPFPVEHKHAFSSCRGNLTVADGGVEYRTTETDHSFYEAYGGLRGFSIQGDELSIRIRNNKKYNFHLINPSDADRIRRLAARHTQVSAGPECGRYRRCSASLTRAPALGTIHTGIAFVVLGA